MRNRAKWCIHLDRERSDEEEYRWSITQDPSRTGWETDSGYCGYGLPKELAQWICDRLNESEIECPYKMKMGIWVKK